MLMARSRRRRAPGKTHNCIVCWLAARERWKKSSTRYFPSSSRAWNQAACCCSFLYMLIEPDERDRERDVPLTSFLWIFAVGFEVSLMMDAVWFCFILMGNTLFWANSERAFLLKRRNFLLKQVYAELSCIYYTHTHMSPRVCKAKITSLSRMFKFPRCNDSNSYLKTRVSRCYC